MKKFLLTSGFLALVLLTACSQVASNSQIPVPQPAKPASQQQSIPATEPMATIPTPVDVKAQAQVKAPPKTVTFNVSGGSFYFTPNTMRAKKGDTVRIVFTNAGGMHNFTLDEFGVATRTLSAGESQAVEFTASKSGSFEYYCSVGSHRAMGQKGTLVIE